MTNQQIGPDDNFEKLTEPIDPKTGLKKAPLNE